MKELASRVAEADAAEARRQLDLQEKEALAGLERAVDRSSLQAFLELPASRREKVRGSHRDPAVAWADALAAHAQAEACIDAVLALRRAADPSGPARERLALLTAHESLLRRLPEGVAALAQAREAAHAEAAAAEARAKLEDQGRSAAARQAELARRREEVARALEDGDPDVALFLVRGYAADPDAAEAAHWKQRATSIARELTVRLRIEVDAAPEGLFAPELLKMTDDGYLTHGLSPDGATAYLVEEVEDFVFLHVVEVATGRIVKRVSLDAPEGFHGPRVTCSAESLLLAGGYGAVLELSARDLSARSWQPGVGDDDETSVQEVLAWPGSRFFWRTVEGAIQPTLQVVDTEHGGRIHKRLEDVFLPTLVAGAGGPYLFSQGLVRPGRVLAGHGAVLCSIPQLVQRIAPTADGTGWLGLATDDIWGGGALHLVALDRSGAQAATADLSEATDGRTSAVATSAEAGLTFVLHEGGTSRRLHQPGDDPPRLSALTVEAGAIRTVWEAQAPEWSCLAQDSEGRKVVAFAPGERGVQAAVLGVAPAAFQIERSTPVFAATPQQTSCGATYWEHPEARVWAERMKHVPESERTAQRLAFCARHASEVEALLCFADELKRARLEEHAQAVRAHVDAQFALHPLLLMERAQLATYGSRWDEVGKIADALNPQAFEGDRRAHVHHLRALVRLQAGDLKAVAAEMEKAAEYPEDPCRARPWVDWVRGLLDEAGTQPPLLRGVRTADACLERGDFEGALRALDVPMVWRALDVQLAARLAFIHLERPTPGQRSKSRYCLASFCEKARHQGYGGERSLVLGPLAWDATRLEAIRKRALLWLDPDAAEDAEEDD